MICHRPADDPATVEIHDGGQMWPDRAIPDRSRRSDIGEPNAVRRGRREVPLEQVRSDRIVMAAVGGPHPAVVVP
jgi:hypothetical protein